MTRRISITLTILFTLLLNSCMNADDIVPQETVDFLAGEWIQEDGSAHIHFYNDDSFSLKFTIPDSHPPLRYLSSIETMKDGFAFSLGNRWQKPVEVIMLDDVNHIDLLMPGEEPRDVLHMKRTTPKAPTP